MAIKPNKTGYIVKNNNDLSEISISNKMNKEKLKKKLKNMIHNKYHIQGIAQAGDYTVLSSSVATKELILAKKNNIVQVESLPNGYVHAGGIGVFEVTNGQNKWMIAVPVWIKNSKNDHRGAILRYYIHESGNGAKLRHDDNGIINLEPKAYAAGIARTQNNGVMIAVMIDGDGNKVQFWKCNDSNGQGKYNSRGDWSVKPKNKKIWTRQKDRWIDPNWGGYPNSISLIEHNGQIYFVGMHNTNKLTATGKDWVDIYKVRLNGNNTPQLTKVGKAHVKCSKAENIFDNIAENIFDNIADNIIDNIVDYIVETRDGQGMLRRILGSSFRWGGSAWMIQNGKIEVLAVGCCFINDKVLYDKFCFNIIPAIHLNPT